MYTLTNTSGGPITLNRADNVALTIASGAQALVDKLTPTMNSAELAGFLTIQGVAESLNVNSQSVTQITSLVTAVATPNAERGLITTFNATNAAGVSSTFTVTNDNVNANSHVRAYIVNYSGTPTANGLPSVMVKNRVAGAFDIVISNNHSANALAGTLVIGWEIVS